MGQHVPLYVLGKMCDDYHEKFGDSWRTVTEDDPRGDEHLGVAIVRYQDPMEADKILKIQRELDETKVGLAFFTRVILQSKHGSVDDSRYGPCKQSEIQQ
jgi:hypothetical protein